MNNSCQQQTIEEDVMKVIDEFARKNKYLPPNEYIHKKLGGSVNKDIKDIRKLAYRLKKDGILQLRYGNMPRLTNSQYSILKHIERFTDENGYPPTVRELCSLTGYSSTSTVHGIVQKIIDKGILKKEAALPRTLTEVNTDEVLKIFDERHLKSMLGNVNEATYPMTVCVINQLSKMKAGGAALLKKDVFKIINNASKIDEELNAVKEKLNVACGK